MAQVYAGRFTAQTDEPFVVFLIGMRINRFWAFTKWIPTAMAMGPMIRTLYEHPESGFLGARTFLSWRGITVLQYWRSFEDVERFARALRPLRSPGPLPSARPNPGDLHMQAWRRFNQTVGYKTGSVGIWHETYAVERGHYEAIYGNMPVTGLAAATKHVRVGGGSETARQRIHALHGGKATVDVTAAAQAGGGKGEWAAGAER